MWRTKHKQILTAIAIRWTTLPIRVWRLFHFLNRFALRYALLEKTLIRLDPTARDASWLKKSQTHLVLRMIENIIFSQCRAWVMVSFIPGRGLDYHYTNVVQTGVPGPNGALKHQGFKETIPIRAEVLCMLENITVFLNSVHHQNSIYLCFSIIWWMDTVFQYYFHTHIPIFKFIFNTISQL